MNPIQAARKFDPQIGRYRAAVAEDTSEGPRGVIIPVAPFVRVRLHRIVRSSGTMLAVDGLMKVENAAHRTALGRATPVSCGGAVRVTLRVGGRPKRPVPRQ